MNTDRETEIFSERRRRQKRKKIERKRLKERE